MTTHRTALVGLAMCPLLAGAAFLAPVVSLPSLAGPKVRTDTVDVPLSAAAAALLSPASIIAQTSLASADPSPVPSAGDPAATTPTTDGPGAVGDPSAAPEVPPSVDPAPEGTEAPAPTDPTAEATPSSTGTPQPAPAQDAAGNGTDPGVLLSPQLRADEFDVVGLTWSRDDADLVTAVQVRTLADGVWSGWTSVDAATEDGPDAGTEEYALEQATGIVGTEPVVAVGSDALQVRLVTSDGSVPASLQATTVDGGDGETADAAVPISSASAATLSRPSLVTRAGWGADESKRRCSPSYSSNVVAATLHHTAGSNSYTASEAKAVVRGIYGYHTGTLGWCDIGYNVLVDKYGTIYEGRYGGLEKAVRGAHTGGFNDKTWGVSLIGNYDTVGVPAAAVSAVSRIVTWKFDVHSVDPSRAVTLTSAGGGTSKYPSGAKVTLNPIFGHRDVGSTACPGRYGYAILPGVRSSVVNSLVDAAFVAKMYRTVLGRDASAGDLGYYTTKMADGWSRKTAVYQLTRSTEFYYGEIDEAYRTVLKRPAEPSGLVYWRDQTFNKGVSLEEFQMHLMLSQEFWVQSGSTNRGFVNNVYKTFLGREADAGGLDYWSTRVSQDGRTSVIKGIFFSGEAAKGRVNDLYLTHLGREADPDGLSGWGAKAIVYGEWYVRDQIVLSPEYLAQAKRGV